jgi:hypothetical protein
MKALGPFLSTKEYFSAHIQLILDLIIQQESYVDRAVDAFLIHRLLLDKVPEACSQTHLDDGKFYLKHADEKGDQILIDDEFNITGIIDWEWAHTDSKSGAFNSPIVLLPVTDFYAGENSIGEDEIFLRSVLKQKGIRISERLSGMAGSSTDSDFVAATTSLIGKDSLRSFQGCRGLWELWASLMISIGRHGRQRPWSATRMIINSNK